MPDTSNNELDMLGWPRPGTPLLPIALREAWYYERIPGSILEAAGLPDTATLGTLDDSIWVRSRNPKRLYTLANYVLELATSRIYHLGEPEVANRPGFLRWPHDEGEIPKLLSKRRSLRAFDRARLLFQSTPLNVLSASDLLSVPGLGVKTLLDLTCSLEVGATSAKAEDSDKNSNFANSTVSSHKTNSNPQTTDLSSRSDSKAVEQLKEEICYLRQNFPLDRISTQDPRFKHLSLLGPTLEDALARIEHSAEHGLSGGASENSLSITREISATLGNAQTENLLQCLNELLTLVTPAGHVRAIARRLGWDGQGGSTLEEAANISGVTRERIRQIEKRVKDRLKVVTYLPILDRAIGVLNTAATTSEIDASTVLVRDNVTRTPFHPYGVWKAAEVFGRTVRFDIETGSSRVRIPGMDFNQFSRALRSLSNLSHVASVEEFHSRVNDSEEGETPLELTRQWLESLDNIVWLDDKHNWMWIPQIEGRNRYFNIIKKVLSVSPVISLRSLREGVLRGLRHRGQASGAPLQVLGNLCHAMGLRVFEGKVSSSEFYEPDSELASVELTMYQVMKQHGGVIDGDEFRIGCVAAGMNRYTFEMYLSFSPIVERLTAGIYALRGTDVDPSRVDVLATQIKRPTKKALQDHGWTKDGAIWLGYEVTPNIYKTSVIGIPSAIRAVTGEGRMDLLTRDGMTIGKLVISDKGAAWGLTPFMHRRGVEVGDSIILTIDTDLECAVIESGPLELIGEFQDGNGRGPYEVLDEITRPDQLE